MPHFLDVLLFDSSNHMIARAKSRFFTVPPPEMLFKECEKLPVQEKKFRGPLYYGVKFVIVNDNEQKINQFALTNDGSMNTFGKYIAVSKMDDFHSTLMGLFTWPTGESEPATKKGAEFLLKLHKRIVVKRKDTFDRELAFECIPPYDLELEIGHINF